MALHIPTAPLYSRVGGPVAPPPLFTPSFPMLMPTLYSFKALADVS